ncbi:MAG TPA: TlpA disulfide reductase family protein [Myxococcota bacterium]|jgi:peroxiredoxin
MSSRIGAGWLAAGVLAAALLAWIFAGEAPPPIDRGSPAPAFDLPQVGEAGSVSLASLRGQVVLLNFWATWCRPCEEELPAMERLHRALAGEDFRLVAISVDAGPDPVLGFQDRLGLGFTLLLDSDQRVARSYQTFRFPETLLIGRDGVILERYVGPKDWDAPVYVDRIRRLLEGSRDTSG